MYNFGANGVLSSQNSIRIQPDHPSFNQNFASGYSGIQHGVEESQIHAVDEFNFSVPLSLVSQEDKHYDRLVRKNHPSKDRTIQRSNTIKQKGKDDTESLKALRVIRQDSKKFLKGY